MLSASATETPAGAPPGPALSWRGVSKSFGPVRALDDVALDVWPGEILGLVGSSGAGKGTPLGIATGLHRPDRGEVVLAPGARLGYTPQEPALSPTLTATVLVGVTAVALGLVVAVVASTDQQIQQLANVLVLLLGVAGGAPLPRLLADAAVLVLFAAALLAVAAPQLDRSRASTC